MGLRVRWKSQLMCLKNHMYFVQSVISLCLYFYNRNGEKYHILPGTLLSSLYFHSLSLYLSIIYLSIYHLSIIYLSIIYLSIYHLSSIYQSINLSIYHLSSVYLLYARMCINSPLILPTTLLRIDACFTQEETGSVRKITSSCSYSLGRAGI